MLRQMAPDIPEVVLVPLDASGQSFKWRHVHGSSWRTDDVTGAHEVAVNPALFERAEDLMATLLREAARAILFEKSANRHIGGCSRDGYYHRHEFRDTCQVLAWSACF